MRKLSRYLLWWKLIHDPEIQKPFHPAIVFLLVPNIEILELLHGITSQEAEGKEHGAKVERDMWQGISDPKIALCRNTAVVGGVAADGRNLGPLIGAGVTAWCFGMSGARTRPNGMISKSLRALKVEVDASVSLLKSCLKHCAGLEVVGKGAKGRALGRIHLIRTSSQLCGKCDLEQ